MEREGGDGEAGWSAAARWGDLVHLRLYYVRVLDVLSILAAIGGEWRFRVKVLDQCAKSVVSRDRPSRLERAAIYLAVHNVD